MLGMTSDVQAGRALEYALRQMTDDDPVQKDIAANRRRVGSVDRAVQTLEALASEPNGLGVNEVARQIGVNPSTASRLLGTLADSGLIVREPSGRFHLGLRLVALADRALARLDVRELARPHLHQLVALTGETATLSLPAGPEAVTVDFVPGTSSVVSMARVGRPNTLHATAIGKTMLAFGNSKERPRTDQLARLTARTITDKAALEAAIVEARNRGWSESVGEREDDLAALAAPTFGPDGHLIAILGLQGPLARMSSKRRREMLAPLLATTAALSRELGSASGR